MDPSFGPIPDLIDEPSGVPPAISDAFTEPVDPNYITSSYLAFQHARVFIDFEGRNIVTILVRLGTHWYSCVDIGITPLLLGPPSLVRMASSLPTSS